MANLAVDYYQSRTTEPHTFDRCAGRSAVQFGDQEAARCMCPRRLQTRRPSEIGRMAGASAHTGRDPGRRLPHVQLQPISRKSVQVCTLVNITVC